MSVVAFAAVSAIVVFYLYIGSLIMTRGVISDENFRHEYVKVSDIEHFVRNYNNLVEKNRVA